MNKRRRWRSEEDRYDYRQPDWQEEQFQSGTYAQPDYQETRYGSSAGQMGEGDYHRDDSSWEGGWADPPSRGIRRARSAKRSRSEDYGDVSRSYGPARYDEAGRGFRSFTGDDQYGADFVAGGRRPQGGYGRGLGGYSARYASGHYGAAPHYGYTDRYEDRGLLERAGDEVASWFGDEDAARRREMDHRGRGPTNYTRSDERILEDACDELTEDWRIDASNIQVSVENGEITLDGTVDSREAKRRAEDCCHDISGVRHVQNNLRIEERSGLGQGSDQERA